MLFNKLQVKQLLQTVEPFFKVTKISELKLLLNVIVCVYGVILGKKAPLSQESHLPEVL